MNKKIISILLIGLSTAAYGQFAFAKKTYCDGKPANIIGTHGDDKIVINDDNTYSINGGAPVAFNPPAIVYGGNGIDRISGSSFNDTICGGNQNDIIAGNDGNDRVFGQNGEDKLYGDSVNAAASCVPGAVTCNDYVVGGNGKDYIQGGDGNDDLEGENAPDVIDGGLGADNIIGGYGQDTCSADALVADTFDGCELNP